MSLLELDLSNRHLEYDPRQVWQLGNGVWTTFNSFEGSLGDIEIAAEDWLKQLNGVTCGWLVWNAHPEWCYAQQRMVDNLGWTPIVGGDPRLPKPPMIDSAVFVDFNRVLKLPYMGPMFPVEFAFMWISKICFFHSDLLLTDKSLRSISNIFETLKKGGTCAVSTFRFGKFWKRAPRAWELIGCTTAGASRNQFHFGAGWWCKISDHPNCPSDVERKKRAELYWDHGAGVLYWKRKYGGNLTLIPLRKVAYGHFSPASKKQQYKRLSNDDKGRILKQQLDANISLESACQELGLDYEYLIDGFSRHG